ncbi:MAG TPA: dynamin family protein [Kofleriaceae bacterium]|jgi:tetratricopeptide (TPR) repeat protein/GTP-binding protein EngB required for normal cell division|nr:dynamin family protein [Kofleriaceae bacterium]
MSLWSRLERRLGDLASELVLDEYRDQLHQARQLLAKGDASAAIDSLEALLKVKPEHGQALILLGEARLVVHEPQVAVTVFERALKARPGDPAALLGHGLALVESGTYELAITALSRAVAEAGGDRSILADAYRGLGLAWRHRGDLDKAIRELRKAVVEDGDDMEARAALGEALVADGGPYDEAMRHLERASASAEPPALALYALGRLALIDEHPAMAGERLAKARAIADAAPTPLGRALRFDIYVAQGDAALAEKNAQRALELFQEALTLEPRKAELTAKVALAHRELGNLDAALASYDRAVALSRDGGIQILRAAIDTAIAANDSTRAMQWANDLLAKDPTDVRAIVARALAMIPGQPAAARALLELAAARDDVDAHVLLAKLSLPDDATGAARCALAALRSAPRDERARAILAEARAAELPAPVSTDIADVAAFLEKIVASKRELGHFVGEVARAAANLDQPLLVTVMGEFSSGKSSFVNAFIGADVAPTGITPTTATINVVRYGRERGGRIIHHDGTTRELGWDPLMQALRSLTPDDARTIDRVEILVPLPHLEKINIVDTPGLNSIQPEHEATARAFIAKADAVVWVFTAAQGGKQSEKKALQSIRDEGKRVLGVLNKADQLSQNEITEVVDFIGGSLTDLVETIVPFSARHALTWKSDGKGDDGNWAALAGALEERFFQQARQLKRDACARTLRAVVGEAQTTLAVGRHRQVEAADAATAARDELIASARQFSGDGVVGERKALSEQMALLYRRAAREVLDLVRPRRLPFSSHTATAADRDYLIALLSSGFETAIETGRMRVATELTTRSKTAESAARSLEMALGFDVVGDLERVAGDRIGLAMSRVFDRARAYLRGYLDGGYVEHFFRNDVPRLELAEDAIYHALYRSAPDLDREVGEPLAHAATDALTALAKRLDHWRAVVDVRMFDLEVGVVRALEIVASRL